MNNKKLISLSLVIGLLSAALACGIDLGVPGDAKEEELAEAVKAQLTVQAVQAAQTALYQGQTQTVIAQQQADLAATQQAMAVVVPTAGGAPTATPIPCNLPKFQSETVPDGTQMDAGQHFAKTWRVKNIGSCTWNTNYRLVFSSGDKMDGPSSVSLGREVRPGETIDLIVDLTAPSSNGEYKGYWKIKSPEGEQFGNYWVQIRVGSPPAAFAVTRVTFNVHPSITMDCPHSVNIKAEITTSAAGTITYKWKVSPGGESSTTSLSFSAAGSKIVDYNPTISASGDYQAQVYIDDPNHQWFGPVNFHVYCNP